MSLLQEMLADKDTEQLFKYQSEPCAIYRAPLVPSLVGLQFTTGAPLGVLPLGDWACCPLGTTYEHHTWLERTNVSNTNRGRSEARGLLEHS